jgi:restriction system protein
MGESQKKGNLKGDVTIKITGAATLALAGHPATVVLEPGLKEDSPPESSPEIILGADLVDVVRETDEGQLIQYVEIPWLAIAEEIARNPDFLFQFDPRKFEEFIAATYDREGWDVELTPRSADGGRDVIATRNDFGSIRVYDEVKRYGKGQRVEAEKVRALSGVVHGRQNVSKGIVTTTAEFAPGVWTDPAIAPLMPNRLELRDGKRLLEWVQSLREKNS